MRLTMRDFTPSYIPLKDSVSGFHLNFLCNIIYANYNLTTKYGYYQDVSHTAHSGGGGCCSIPCLFEVRWGITNYTYIKDSGAVGILDNTANTPYKLYMISETADADAITASPGARVHKSESTITSCGILCCLGPKSVKERLGLFSKTSPRSTVPSHGSIDEIVVAKVAQGMR